MNPTNNTNAVRMKAESSLAAFIRNFYDPNTGVEDFDQSKLDVKCRRPGTVLDGLPIYEGQTPQGFEVPCIVVNSVNAKRMDTETTWSEVDVDIHVMTHLEEANEGTEVEGEEPADPDGTAKSLAALQHAERLGFVTELLEDPNVVMTQINQPATGDDERPVKDFAVFGMWLENESSTQTDLQWDDTQVYKLACMPADPQEA